MVGVSATISVQNLVQERGNLPSSMEIDDQNSKEEHLEVEKRFSIHGSHLLNVLPY